MFHEMGLLCSSTYIFLCSRVQTCTWFKQIVSGLNLFLQNNNTYLLSYAAPFKVVSLEFHTAGPANVLANLQKWAHNFWTWKKPSKMYVLPSVCSPKATFNMSKDSVVLFPHFQENCLQTHCPLKSTTFLRMQNILKTTLLKNHCATALSLPCNNSADSTQLYTLH
jgi:hypothetical protein